MTSEDLTPRQALMREAALWLARLDSGTADRAAFEAWRDADPRRAAAVARLAGVTHQLDRARPLIEESDVESLARPRDNRRTIMWGLAAATVAGVCGVGGFAMWGESRASAVTGIGDRQVIGLPGGGRLDLNTNTKVFYKFDQNRHRVWLERGEVAIIVPPGQLPCELISGTGQVKIAAGRLNARLKDRRLDVTMQQGTCTVAPDGAKPKTVLANQVALIGPGAVEFHATSDADRAFATGWQTDELILDGQTLTQAVDEFNRYQISKIQVTDPNLGDIRLGGRFSLHDPSDFLASLQTGFAIKSTKTANGDILLSR